MRYDLATNSIVGNDGFINYIANRIAPGEFRELDLICDFLKLMADGSWGRFLDIWDFDIGDRDEALYSYLRLLRKAEMSTSALQTSQVTRR